MRKDKEEYEAGRVVGRFDFNEGYMMTTLDRLIRGRERITKGWCQGATSRTDDGSVVEPCSNDASQWCLFGAVWDIEDEHCDEAMEILKRAGGSVYWNDTPGRTQSEVLAVFDRAIELCRADQEE